MKSGKIEASVLKREFVDIKTKMILPDPNPLWTPEQVMNYYSTAYPHLINGSVEGPEIGPERVTYNFRTTVGDKG